MSKTLEEIEKYSLEEDKRILRWLFTHYHTQSEWRFVASFREQRYGVSSYEVHHVWKPTIEGLAIFKQLS
jgi:hypothetical protein